LLKKLGEGQIKGDFWYLRHTLSLACSLALNVANTQKKKKSERKGKGK
jgi:hypothetical protein